MARLVLDKGSRVQAYPLDRPVIRIGRTQDSEIRLADAGVSREHARVFQVGQDYFLEDLGSRNGTWVDGARISQHRLKTGERVQIGACRFLFESDAPARP